MTQVQSFFKLIETPGALVQIGTLQQVKAINSDEVADYINLNKKNDLYFLGGIDAKIKDPNHRADDESIIVKTYVAFDFDIRKMLGKGTDEELEEGMKVILDALKSSDLFKDYGAAICSGNGLHVYYFSYPVDLKNRRAEYALGYDSVCSLMDGVIRTHLVFNGIDLPVLCPDRACKNTGRIMRVPTSWNHKNNQNLPVRFLEFTGKRSELLSSLLEAGSAVKEETSPSESSLVRFHKPKLTTNLDSLAGLTRWEQLRLIDNKFMLERLSGSYLVNKERYRFKERGGSGGWLIYVQGNDTPINAWIDADGYIGSPGIQGRTWVEWVMNWPDFKRSARELMRWVDDNLRLPDAVSGRVTNIVLTTPRAIVDSVEKVFSSYKSRFFWLTPAIDKEMPVFMPGDYVLAVGDTGVGKTTMAMHFAIENAKRGRNVVYFSLEQSPKQLLENYLAQLVGVTEEMQKADQVKLEHNQRAWELLNALPATFKFPYLPNSSEQLTALDIKHTIQMYPDVELVVIDNLGFLRQPDQDEEWQELKELNRMLVQLAHSHDKPVGIFALHHFRKGIGMQKGPKDNDMIRGSRKLIDDADLVLQITREELTPEHVGTLKDQIMKKRTLYVTKDRRHGRMRNVEYFLHKGILQDYYEDVLPDNIF